MTEGRQGGLDEEEEEEEEEEERDVTIEAAAEDEDHHNQRDTQMVTTTMSDDDNDDDEDEIAPQGQYLYCFNQRANILTRERCVCFRIHLDRDSLRLDVLLIAQQCDV